MVQPELDPMRPYPAEKARQGEIILKGAGNAVHCRPRRHARARLDPQPAEVSHGHLRRHLLLRPLRRTEERDRIEGPRMSAG
jgi:hypothetical protein